MKLGTILARITETEGKDREKLQREFLERMKGHPEEKLLTDCYVAACKGNKYISFGRNGIDNTGPGDGEHIGVLHSAAGDQCGRNRRQQRAAAPADFTHNIFSFSGSTGISIP